MISFEQVNERAGELIRADESRKYANLSEHDMQLIACVVRALVEAINEQLAKKVSTGNP